MKKTGLIIIATILLCSCGEEKPPLTVHQQVVQEEGFPADTLCGEYKRFVGTVAGQPVVVHYVRNGNVVSCQYYYEKHGKAIAMHGLAGKFMQFAEQPATERTEGNQAAWSVVIERDSMKGEWISGDSSVTYPILLKEDYTNNALQFSVVCMTDSIPFDDNTPGPRATTEYQVLLPVGNEDITPFVRTAIYRCIGCDSIEGDDMKSCLDGLKTNYFRDYRHVGDGEKALLQTNSSAFEWSEQTNFWVMYNDDGLVVLNHHLYSYTGGAHGNYASDYLCIDATNKKVLKLEDIMLVDTAKLVPLLNTETRKLYSMKEEEPLNEYLLADELYVPGQFYISHKGITFVYTIYEIAPYSDGEVNLFIPYNKITDMLTPWFKQRMRLEQVALNK